MIENTELLDKIITGYVPHKIYAFSTPQLLNYLKVGETSRSVKVRLSEWRKLISDLKLEKDWLAMLPKDDVEQTEFFQDYTLHDYFKKHDLKPMDYNVAPGNSKEFYPVTIQDIEHGIDEISEDYLSEPPREYTYLSIKDNLRVEEHWKRNEDFTPRENQQSVIDNILAASKDVNVPRNYLLFAVMRFGKTFVALEAAKVLSAKLTVVVSAKADVKGEWKKNLETHVDFEDYKFLDSDSLKNSDTAIQETLDSAKKVVLFLTLQDLNGANTKEKHRQLFDRKVDLLIVDESHFGARAQSYGQVIHKWVGTGKKKNLRTIDAYEEQTTDDKEDSNEVRGLENVKAIDTTYTLHLSGTPYRILMGNEFDNPKQIVGKVQFEEILEEKAKWFEEHLEEPEWKNPYFGFPQMVRFAFNLSDSAMSKLNALTIEGKTSRLNELFGPLSNKKVDEDHTKFKHEEYVLETLKALDGSKNSKTIFPVINYDKIKEGKMAHHIVMVLPYKASCDAMAKLLSMHKDDFYNLGNYKILNIAGYDSNFTNQGNSATEKVREKIEKLANEGKKTICLTVNKMLTGVTVPQWDTMIFLKDTQSPQEYDQAIYRLQSPYVTKQYDTDGKIVSKEDLKPQTLLIDFSPNRMMSIEQYKAFIFSASEGEVGNDRVEQLLKRQMEAAPIITMNAEKLTQVKPVDVLKYVAAYSSEKGIIEEASEISVDLSILDNPLLKEVIENENEIGGKSGLKFSQNEDGEDTSYEDDINTGNDSEDSVDNPDAQDDLTGDSTSNGEDASEEEKLEKKVQNYYLRILFYAFLSKETEINNLSDVINSYDNNQRLAHHLGLEKNVLEILAQELRQPFVRSDLDNKISNANALLADESVKASDKNSRAIQSFKRISESEVFTPRHIAERMIDDLFVDINFSDFNKKPKRFIDLTSKSGIYLLVLYEKLLAQNVEPIIARKSLYAVTTSPIAYEFTRKVFELMGFPVENILDIGCASSYDLISKTNRSYPIDRIKQYFFKGDDNMKFDVVVGNPPYNESDKDDGKGSSKPLYNLFINLARSMSPDNISLITPSVWFLGGKGLGSFRKSMLLDSHFKDFENFITAKDVFENVNLRGGVNYFIWDKHYDNSVEGITVNEFHDNKLISSKKRSFTLKNLNMFIADNYGFSILKRFIDNKIIDVDYENSEKTLAHYVSERNPFGYSTTFKEFEENKGDNSQYKIYRAKGKTGYVTKTTLKKGQELVDKVKVITPFANNISTDLPDDNLNTQVIGPNEIVTETYLVIGAGLDLTVNSAENLEKYLKTKFVRYLIGLAKANQNGTRQTYRFVPLQNFSGQEIDWGQTIEKIDQQLFMKYGFDQEESHFIKEKVKTMY